ncbi:MAG: GDSL-type esterase/lipase family protein [Limisphaerales bacterium]
MKKFRLPFLFAIAATFLFTNAPAFAQDTNQNNTAIIPAIRGNPKYYHKRHAQFMAINKKGGVDLLFLGDSITDFWRNHGSNVWNKYYAPLHAANFGISGDRTQNVIWRIDHGELDGLKPKVIVLLIGTNNGNDNSPAEIAGGIRVILDKIHEKCPKTKVLLLGVFPRNRRNDTQKQIVAPRKINILISQFGNGGAVRYLNINDKFLDKDGKVPASIMPDFLHPNEHGYQIWAQAMNPTLMAMMK